MPPVVIQMREWMFQKYKEWKLKTKPKWQGLCFMAQVKDKSSIISDIIVWERYGYMCQIFTLSWCTKISMAWVFVYSEY